MARIALSPAHPERICWGCDKYCAADDLACGNGTIRTLHPCELFGGDWLQWLEARALGRGAFAVGNEAPMLRPCPQPLKDSRDEDARVI